MKNTFLLCILFFTFLCNQVFAQEKISISAPDSVPVNREFELKIVIENAVDSSFNIPDISAFESITVPNTSDTRQWSHYTESHSITYYYFLKPRQVGTFKIGRASITRSGVSLVSNELTVKVTPVAMDTSIGTLAKTAKDDVFIKLKLSKDTMYMGDMLTATYMLYFRLNLEDVYVGKGPPFDDFRCQKVALDMKRSPSTETINGKQFNIFELVKYNLYPQKTGDIQVPAMEVSTLVQVTTGDAVDRAFGRGELHHVPMTLKSEPEIIVVKKRPQKK